VTDRNESIDSDFDITITVNGKAVPMNPFVQRIFTRTLLGMISALDEVDEPVHMELSLGRKSHP
jgi:hypothetical protein